jgi:hypothetical protein
MTPQCKPVKRRSRSGNPREREGYEDERNRRPDADVEQDSFGTTTRVKDATLLAEHASQASASRLHENEGDQADR